jgi:PKD repeat protein
MATELPATIRLDGTDSFDSDGRITDYEWELNDGRRFNQASTEVDFGEGDAGSYTATLTVTDDDGATATDRVRFELKEPPEQPPNARFSISPQSGTAPFTATLDASASNDPDGSIRAYYWKFNGDQFTRGETVDVEFTEDDVGTVEIGLTVTDFDANADAKYRNVTVRKSNQPPNADFTISPQSGTAPFTATFDASASNDPDGSIRDYAWTFRDGGRQRGRRVSKRFTKADVGTNTVSLTVTDDDDAEDSRQKTVTVRKPQNQPPNAVIQADKRSGREPLTVTFDASNSTPGNDPYDPSLSFAWFVNQNRVTNSGPTLTETFDAGTQLVKVEVTDSQGATDSASTTVDVKLPPNDPPTALADATPGSGEVPVEIEFTGRNSSDPNNNIDSYSWEFSDGISRTGKTVTRNFGKDAPQQVTGTLTVTDARGEVDTDSVTVTLSQPGGIIGDIDNETVAQATIVGAGIASSLIFD